MSYDSNRVCSFSSQNIIPKSSSTVSKVKRSSEDVDNNNSTIGSFGIFNSTAAPEMTSSFQNTTTQHKVNEKVNATILDVESQTVFENVTTESTIIENVTMESTVIPNVENFTIPTKNTVSDENTPIFHEYVKHAIWGYVAVCASYFGFYLLMIPIEWLFV